MCVVDSVKVQERLIFPWEKIGKMTHSLKLHVGMKRLKYVHKIGRQSTMKKITWKEVLDSSEIFKLNSQNPTN